jgi:uncharacterized protein YecE (DUF72 family)
LKLEVRIGTGGWGYLSATGDRLKAYAKLFDFVEVNSTFYSNPALGLVSSWRSRVPDNFEFSVKCNRVITHEHSLRPDPEVFAEVDYMLKICKILRANCIIFQTPSSLNVDFKILDEAKPVFTAFQSRGITPVLEVRNVIEQQTILKMKEMGIVHSVDLTRSIPEFTGELLYTRLFGLNRYARTGFTEQEYNSILEGLNNTKPKKAYLAFHGIQMYNDAQNFKKLLSDIH